MFRTKRENLLKNGMSKFTDSLDFIKLLKSTQHSNILFRTTLAQKQRLLLNMQRREVITSDSEAIKSHESADMDKH